MGRYASRYALMAVVVGALLVLSLSVAQASRTNFQPKFNSSANSEEEMQRCIDSTGLDLDTLSAATASLHIIQFHAKTWLLIRVRNAAPNTLFTVWLKLAAISPFTGVGVTALANIAAIDTLAAVTPEANILDDSPLKGAGDDGAGSNDLEDIVNGFVTNRQGHGRYLVHLNFPVKKGAYPFQEHLASLAPVAVGNTPFALRLASHCLDGVGHGLVPGAHERWFDWQWQP